MLLAIDVGNSHTVFGLWNGSSWIASWRHRTDIDSTEDEIAAWLTAMFERAGIPFSINQAACASVVPGMDRTLGLLCKKYFGTELIFLTSNSDHGISVDYSPASSVGADRIANAIAALKRWQPPIIVVDFGTATTFDVIDAKGVYIGGAILAGPVTSLSALVSKTAKLPAIELKAPDRVIGKSTSHSIASGIMYGYAEAIDGLTRRMCLELGRQAKVVSTGGLGAVFVDLCEQIQEHDESLTLDGIRFFVEAAKKA
jgi:type III pantothenate kinase